MYVLSLLQPADRPVHGGLLGLMVSTQGMNHDPNVTRLVAIKENLTELRSIPSIAADLVAALLVEESLHLAGQLLEETVAKNSPDSRALAN